MKKILVAALMLLWGWPAFGQNFNNYPGITAKFMRLPTADAGSTGDISGMSVTAGGNTRTLGQWMPTFLAANGDGSSLLVTAGGTTQTLAQRFPLLLAKTGDASLTQVTANGVTTNLSYWLTTFLPYNGDAGNTFVTALGSTKTLANWLPSFALLDVANPGKSLYMPYLSVGRPTSDPVAIWVNNDNLLGSFVPGQVKQFVISDNGGYSALVTANRTSDQPSTTTQSVLSDTCLSVNDNTVTAHMNWCRYTHSSLKANSKISLSLGEENSLENLSSFSVATDPFSNVGPGSGVTAALRLTSGIGRPANDISAYFQMINNGGAKAKSGIVFSWDALNTSGGAADALAMGPNHAITWYNGLGTPGWKILQNSNTGSGAIVLGSNNMDFYIGGGGFSPFHADTSGVTIGGTLKATGVTQLASYQSNTLPTCANDALQGAMALITDAPSNYTYRQAVVGGGTTRAPVFCTGGQWEFH